MLLQKSSQSLGTLDFLFLFFGQNAVWGLSVPRSFTREGPPRETCLFLLICELV